MKSYLKLLLIFYKAYTTGSLAGPFKSCLYQMSGLTPYEFVDLGREENFSIIFVGIN